MTELAAFIGHSFTADDSDVVREFLDFFETVQDMGIDFSWDHAERAEPKLLAQKVLEKMSDKNLFVGICTARECVIDSKKLSPGFWNKGVLKGNRNSFRSKTSDWILQEIGVAKGRAMDIILLVEEGVRDPGGLQGDLEFIPFRRSAPAESFIKLLEMIRSLSPRPIDTETGLVQQPPESEDERQPGDEPLAEALTPTADWTYSKYSFGLLLSIMSEDEAKEAEIHEAYIATLDAEDTAALACWKAERLYLQFRHRKKDTLARVVALSQANPDEPRILGYLAAIHDSYEQFDVAADYHEKAALKRTDETAQLRSLCLAALCYAKARDNESRERLLDQAAELGSGQPEETIILEALSDIAKAEADDDAYLALNEAIINRKPDDHSRRFATAYKYSELDRDDLALYHYRLLAPASPTWGNWNNLAVSQNTLELPARAVESYRRAEALGGTLAMSNLAHKFIAAGFLPEAQGLCDRATAMPNYDKSIGGAITALKTMETTEADKEKEIVDKTHPRRALHIGYGNACLKPKLADSQAVWSAPNGEVSITVKGRNLEGETRVMPESMAWLVRGDPQASQALKFKGTIRGRGAVFTRWIVGEEAETSVSGIMAFSDDGHGIDVYEHGGKSKEKLYEMRRAP